MVEDVLVSVGKVTNHSGRTQTISEGVPVGKVYQVQQSDERLGHHKFSQ